MDANNLFLKLSQNYMIQIIDDMTPMIQ